MRTKNVYWSRVGDICDGLKSTISPTIENRVEEREMKEERKDKEGVVNEFSI